MMYGKPDKERIQGYAFYNKGTFLAFITLSELSFFRNRYEKRNTKSKGALFLFAPLPLEVKRVFLGVISFGTLPFSIFSLYYQGRILKTWCALCVLIQILLLLEVFFGSLDLLSSGIIIQSARAGALISLCVAFTLPPRFGI
jgi:hypothetical protein